MSLPLDVELCPRAEEWLLPFTRLLWLGLGVGGTIVGVAGWKFM